LEVTYASKKEEKIITNERLCKRIYGSLSMNIRIRVAELEAASSLLDIPETPPPQRHKLTGKEAHCWALRVSRNFRIVLCPSGTYSLTDLSSIVAVQILRIEDYH
jgi:proteic killer suppression protein